MSAARSSAAGSRRVALMVALCGALAPGLAAQAFELDAVEAGRDGAVFELRIDARFDATPAQVLATLTDFDRIHELHPGITGSRSLGAFDADSEEVYSRFEGCVLFFCRTVHRVERFSVRGGSLFAEDIQGRGSFSQGRSEWRLSPHGEGARLRYATRFVPDFWVPPLIGARVVARFMERMTLETLAELDRRAVAR